MINGFIDKVNAIHIPDWEIFGKYKGASLNIKKIPMLANGGIADKATLAMIGEGNSSEAVVPLDKRFVEFIADAMKQVRGAGNLTVNFYPQTMTESELNNAFNYINRRFGFNL